MDSIKELAYFKRLLLGSVRRSVKLLRNSQTSSLSVSQVYFAEGKLQEYKRRFFPVGEKLSTRDRSKEVWESCSY